MWWVAALCCGVFISSILWCFYIIYFVVIFFSMVHPILVRFYYFPLLFIIYDFDRSQMIFASILFKDTDHLLILSGNVPGSRVTVPKNQPSIFCDKNLLIFCHKGNNFCVLPQQWLPLQTEEVNSLSHGGNASDIQVPIKMLAIRCPVMIKKLLMAAYIY